MIAADSRTFVMQLYKLWMLLHQAVYGCIWTSPVSITLASEHGLGGCTFRYQWRVSICILIPDLHSVSSVGRWMRCVDHLCCSCARPLSCSVYHVELVGACPQVPCVSDQADRLQKVDFTRSACFCLHMSA